MVEQTRFCMSDYAKLTSIVHEIDNQYLPDTLLAGQMGYNVVQVQQFLTDVSVTHHTASYQYAEEAAQSFKRGIESLRAQSKNDSAALEELNGIWSSFTINYETGKQMADVYIKKGRDAGNVLMEEFDVTTLALNERTNKLRDQKRAAATQKVHELKLAADASTKVIHNSTLAGIILGILIASYLVYYVGSNLSIEAYYDAKTNPYEVANAMPHQTAAINHNVDQRLLHPLKVPDDSSNDAFIAAINEITKAFNVLLNTPVAENQRLSEIISAHARGNFSESMGCLPGENKISTAVDDVKQSLLKLSNEIKLLAELDKQADFNKHPDASNLESKYNEILTDINLLFDTFDTPTQKTLIV